MTQIMDQVMTESQCLASGIATLTGTQTEALNELLEDNIYNNVSELTGMLEEANKRSRDSKDAELLQKPSDKILMSESGEVEEDNRHLAGSLQDLFTSAKQGEVIK